MGEMQLLVKVAQPQLGNLKLIISNDFLAKKFPTAHLKFQALIDSHNDLNELNDVFCILSNPKYYSKADINISEIEISILKSIRNLQDLFFQNFEFDIYPEIFGYNIRKYIEIRYLEEYPGQETKALKDRLTRLHNGSNLEMVWAVEMSNTKKALTHNIPCVACFYEFH